VILVPRRRLEMDQSFDIFLVVREGEISFVESATSLAKAKVRVDELGARLTGKYMILGKPSGERTIILSKPKNPQKSD
jgi:hypothetical protein